MNLARHGGGGKDGGGSRCGGRQFLSLFDVAPRSVGTAHTGK